MSNYKPLLMSSLIAVLTLSGCSTRVTSADLVGTYKSECLQCNAYVKRNLGKEILMLKSDGTYIQTYTPKRGKPIRVTGGWVLDTSFGEPIVHISNMMYILNGLGRFNSPAQKLDGWLPVSKSGNSILLDVNDDLEQRYRKLGGSGHLGQKSADNPESK
ncbi:MAG: hypothetical protein Q7N50_14050 [Armatimonadota bacterium]|nr:hypothetical protein [Armatimonadota bacterium]